MTLNISLVSPEQREIALRLLFARFPVEEQPSRLADALRSANEGRLNLDRLILAEENGLPVGVTLMMRQADGVSLVWPPVLSCQASDVTRIEDSLMSRICVEIDRADSKLAQALLSPDDDQEMELLQRHGFDHMADMFFLARQLTEADLQASTDSGDLDHELYTPENAHRFAAIIERTYINSLDCPFLEGFRNGTDALASHRLSGVFDPDGWRIYRLNDQDIGVLLMNEHPDQRAIELVYFGIVPEFRGRGLGQRVLSDGIQAAALAGGAVMFLAVDYGNTYANALYGAMNFAELARRRVMVRRFLPVARK